MFPSQVLLLLRLEVLDISSNEFYGAVPDGIADLTQLRVRASPARSCVKRTPQAIPHRSKFATRFPLRNANLHALSRRLSARALAQPSRPPLLNHVTTTQHLGPLSLDHVITSPLPTSQLPLPPEPSPATHKPTTYYVGTQVLSLSGNSFKDEFPGKARVWSCVVGRVVGFTRLVATKCGVRANCVRRR